MPRPEADWKNQAREVGDWITMLVGVVIVASYLYAWWQSGEMRYLGISGLVLGWLFVYVSPFWQPILYLVLAVVLMPYLALLVWRGAWELPVARIGLATTGVLLLLVLFLFFREERPEPAA